MTRSLLIGSWYDIEILGQFCNWVIYVWVEKGKLRSHKSTKFINDINWSDDSIDYQIT